MPVVWAENNWKFKKSVSKTQRRMQAKIAHHIVSAQCNDDITIELNSVSQLSDKIWVYIQLNKTHKTENKTNNSKQENR